MPLACRFEPTRSRRAKPPAQSSALLHHPTKSHARTMLSMKYLSVILTTVCLSTAKAAAIPGVAFTGGLGTANGGASTFPLRLSVFSLTVNGIQLTCSIKKCTVPLPLPTDVGLSMTVSNIGDTSGYQSFLDLSE